MILYTRFLQLLTTSLFCSPFFLSFHQSLSLFDISTLLFLVLKIVSLKNVMKEKTREHSDRFFFFKESNCFFFFQREFIILSKTSYIHVTIEKFYFRDKITMFLSLMSNFLYFSAPLNFSVACPATCTASPVCNKLHIALIRLAFHRFSFAVLAFAGAIITGIKADSRARYARREIMFLTFPARKRYFLTYRGDVAQRSIVIVDYYVRY